MIRPNLLQVTRCFIVTCDISRPAGITVNSIVRGTVKKKFPISRWMLRIYFMSGYVCHYDSGCSMTIPSSSLKLAIIEWVHSSLFVFGGISLTHR